MSKKLKSQEAIQLFLIATLTVAAACGPTRKVAPAAEAKKQDPAAAAAAPAQADSSTATKSTTPKADESGANAGTSAGAPAPQPTANPDASKPVIGSTSPGSSGGSSSGSDQSGGAPATTPGATEPAAPAAQTLASQIERVDLPMDVAKLKASLQVTVAGKALSFAAKPESVLGLAKNGSLELAPSEDSKEYTATLKCKPEECASRIATVTLSKGSEQAEISLKSTIGLDGKLGRVLEKDSRGEVPAGEKKVLAAIEKQSPFTPEVLAPAASVLIAEIKDGSKLFTAKTLKYVSSPGMPSNPTAPLISTEAGFYGSLSDSSKVALTVDGNEEGVIENAQVEFKEADGSLKITAKRDAGIVLLHFGNKQ